MSDGVLGIAALILIFGMMAVLLNANSGSKEEILKRRIRVKSKNKVLVIGWFINLVIFAAVLWGGSYAISIGVTWIEMPCNVTLGSCGIAKAVLTLLIMHNLLFDEEKEVEK